MTIIPINNKQASITACFFVYIMIKYMFKLIQADILITPPLFRSSKVCNIFSVIKIIKPGIYYLIRLAFIN